MTPEQRIEKLKRENLRFRRTGTALLAAACAILVVGIGLLATGRAGAQNTPKPGVVTGNEFRLVDTSGITRAELMMENGNPVLRFFDDQGKSRAAVGLQEYGPYLFFARANGKPGASIGVGPLGPAMAFGDSAGNVRIMLTVDTTGTPAVALRDTTGHTSWTAP